MEDEGRRVLGVRSHTIYPANCALCKGRGVLSRRSLAHLGALGLTNLGTLGCTWTVQVGHQREQRGRAHNFGVAELQEVTRPAERGVGQGAAGQGLAHCCAIFLSWSTCRWTSTTTTIYLLVGWSRCRWTRTVLSEHRKEHDISPSCDIVPVTCCM